VVPATRRTGVVDIEAPTVPLASALKISTETSTGLGSSAAIRDPSDPAPGTEFLWPETAPSKRPTPPSKTELHKAGITKGRKCGSFLQSLRDRQIEGLRDGPGRRFVSPSPANVSSSNPLLSACSQDRPVR
jgi:hypothetical protein